ncbi:MAG TPA: NAD+ synthase [Rhodospirillaceae bacterium]|nr:MAG: NAD+ synthase [Alphaproteobacteria bacterium GWF2_58_20]HAU29319.1 NAD+ synthase [Rhodospirillaceae bacterium]
MPNQIRIALAQFNPTLGDISSNAARILEIRERAARMNADLVAFPELSLCGYPPEDLILKTAFLTRCEEEIRTMAAATARGPALLVGSPWRQNGHPYNAVILMENGSISAITLKHDLPNTGVFDEKRTFTSGPLPRPISFHGVNLGVLICEDMWHTPVSTALKESGAQILLAINGSPFEVAKDDLRHRHALARINETGLPLIYLNQVGGQDELVFDGQSFVLNADGSEAVSQPLFAEDLCLTTWTKGNDGTFTCAEGEKAPSVDILESIYLALMIGLRDYVGKIGFPGVILGMSGGIDSALSAAIAADALGGDKVWGVMMPSKYSSEGSVSDAEESGRLLGMKMTSVPIVPAVEAYAQMLKPVFEGKAEDVTEENIQARIRGMILMAMSNKFGPMVLSTGNKSEMSVGYSTLYGDMCGGYSVLKDVYKTTVFALSEWRNSHKPKGALGPDGMAIPRSSISKPPSAELKPDQVDQDSLPPYPALDDILEGLVEKEMSVEQIASRGHDEATIRRIWKMLDRAEYKRRQSPPGVKITKRAFGRERRYPIVNKFKA